MKTRHEEIVKHKGKLGCLILDEYSKESKEYKEKTKKLNDGMLIRYYRFMPIEWEGTYSCENLDLINWDEITPQTRLTEEEKDEYITKKYTWGKVIKLHKISDIQIIESEEPQGNHSIYINHESMSISENTLDQAIFHALTLKHGFEELNSTIYKLMKLEEK